MKMKINIPPVIRNHFAEAAAWTTGALAVIATPFAAESWYRTDQEQYRSLMEAFSGQATTAGIAMAVGGALVAGIGATALRHYYKALKSEESRLYRSPSQKP